MSDDFHSKLSDLVSQLNDLVQGTSTQEETPPPESHEEGDPGVDDNFEAEGDSKPFADGAHDKHVGADASFSPDKGSPAFGGDDEEKSGKKAMLLSLLKKHGG